jgi:hypothetical protein
MIVYLGMLASLFFMTCIAKQLIESGAIRPCLPELIVANGYTIRMGQYLLDDAGQRLDLTYVISHVLKPGETVIAQSIEGFVLPEAITISFELLHNLEKKGLEHEEYKLEARGHGEQALMVALTNLSEESCIILDHGMKLGVLHFESAMCSL